MSFRRHLNVKSLISVGLTVFSLLWGNTILIDSASAQDLTPIDQIVNGALSRWWNLTDAERLVENLQTLCNGTTVAESGQPGPGQDIQKCTSFSNSSDIAITDAATNSSADISNLNSQLLDCVNALVSSDGTIQGCNTKEPNPIYSSVSGIWNYIQGVIYEAPIEVSQYDKFAECIQKVLNSTRTWTGPVSPDTTDDPCKCYEYYDGIDYLSNCISEAAEVWFNKTLGGLG